MSEKNYPTKVGLNNSAVVAESADLEHGSQKESPDWINREKMFRFLKLK
jgi:hypothetical protein